MGEPTVDDRTLDRLYARGEGERWQLSKSSFRRALEVSAAKAFAAREPLAREVEQYLDAYTVTTPATGFTGHYINVIIRTASISSAQMDGQPIPSFAFTPIGSTGFSGAQLTVAVGSHHLAASTPFAVTVYGFAEFESYGYPGGMSVAPLPFATSLVLTPETETSNTGVPRCVTALVTGDAGAPTVGVRVDFVVSGANAATGFEDTDAQGTALFCYTGTVAGTDSIVATMGVLSDSATKTWESGNAPPVAADQSVTTAEDTAAGITLSATDPDNDPLTYAITTAPAHGTLSGTAPNLTYTPVADYSGSDSFTFKANDGQLDSNTATVSITPPCTARGVCQRSMASMTMKTAVTPRAMPFKKAARVSARR